MVEPNRQRTILTCFIAVMMTIGFTAAPVAAVDIGGDDGISIDTDDGIGVGVGGDDGISVDADEEDGVSVDAGGDDGVSIDDDEIPLPDGETNESDDESDDSPAPVNYSDVPLEDVPADLCYDAAGEAQERVPFEEVPWFDDLPEEVPPPPGVPTDVLTPESAAAIAFGFVPHQCDVQDPYDPSVDPTDPPREPDADVDVQRFGQFEDGAVALVRYDLTMNESGEGPGVSGMVGGLGTTEFGDADLELTVNDGEKDYSVDPRVRYFDDGTAFGETDVVLFGQRLGVEVDCDGEECQPGLRGLPELTDIPAVPAPTEQDDDDGNDEEAGPFPEAICTDVGDEAQENVPFEEVPWFDDLPEEVPPPPGVPTDVITPESAAAIAFGFVPNQCDVQDPNDPSIDPTDPPREPGGDFDVVRFGEFEDGAVALVRYDLTMNESGEGPGVSGMVGGLGTSEFGDVDLELTVNDGEKDYSVDPRVRYQEGGSVAFGETDVVLFGQRLGVEVDCDGEECQPGLRGVPELVDIPSVPAPTDGGGD